MKFPNLKRNGLLSWRAWRMLWHLQPPTSLAQSIPQNWPLAGLCYCASSIQDNYPSSKKSLLEHFNCPRFRTYFKDFLHRTHDNDEFRERYKGHRGHRGQRLDVMQIATMEGNIAFLVLEHIPADALSNTTTQGPHKYRRVGLTRTWSQTWEHEEVIHEKVIRELKKHPWPIKVITGSQL